jgi:hypothetical protein
MTQQITIQKEFNGQTLVVHCLADMRTLSVSGFGTGPHTKKVCLHMLWIKSNGEKPFFFNHLTQQQKGTFKSELMNREFHYQHGKTGPFAGSRAVIVKETKSLR